MLITDICLICLRTDKSLKVVDTRLSDIHDKLTDCTIASFAGIRQYCLECEHQLKKAYNFKLRCTRAVTVLQYWKDKHTAKEHLHSLIPVSTIGLWNASKAAIFEMIKITPPSMPQNPGEPHTSQLQYVSSGTQTDKPIRKNLIPNVQEPLLNANVRLPILQQDKPNLQETTNVHKFAPNTQNLSPNIQLFVSKPQNLSPHIQNFAPNTHNFAPNTVNISQNVHSFAPNTQNLSQNLHFGPNTQNLSQNEQHCSPNTQNISQNGQNFASNSSDNVKQEPDDPLTIKTENVMDIFEEENHNVIENNVPQSENIDVHVPVHTSLVRLPIATVPDTPIVTKKVSKKKRAPRKQYDKELRMKKEMRKKEQSDILRLKAELMKRFESCEDLKYKDSSAVDKLSLIKIIETKYNDPRVKELRSNMIKHSTLTPRILALLRMLQNKYTDKYDSVFDTEHLDTVERVVEEFERRKIYESYLKNQFRCDHCHQSFEYKKKLEYHMRSHDAKTGEFVCSLCMTRHRTKIKLNRHKNTHNIVYKCKLCPLITNYRYSMINHYFQHKGLQYTCETCKLTYRSRSGYQTHLTYSCARRQFVCTGCARVFIAERGLKLHMLKKHRDDPPIDPRKSGTCSKCDLRFPNKEVFLRHLRNTH